jgi:BlaI family transcriptional regulator, penicillinase repressor
MKLSKTEEQLMGMIWKHQRIFMKELIENHPEPKPAATTIATLLKRMQEKGYVGYETFGNSRQYFALVRKSDHFSKQMNGIVKDYFGDSALQFASFFTKSSNFTSSELEELKAIIEQQIKQKSK